MNLVLIGRQRVDRIVNQAEAERYTLNTRVWQAEFHAICDEPEEKVVINLSLIARRLGFDGIVDRLPDGFTGKNLQTMRRLDEPSAERVKRIWANRHDEIIGT